MYKQHNGLQHVLLTCRSTSLFGSRPPNHPASHADAARPLFNSRTCFRWNKAADFWQFRAPGAGRRIWAGSGFCCCPSGNSMLIPGMDCSRAHGVNACRHSFLSCAASPCMWWDSYKRGCAILASLSQDDTLSFSFHARVAYFLKAPSGYGIVLQTPLMRLASWFIVPNVNSKLSSVKTLNPKA